MMLLRGATRVPALSQPDACIVEAPGYVDKGYVDKDKVGTRATVTSKGERHGDTR